ncbi:MAG: ferrochelatase [Ectothiorhodospiraceae bacterium]|nr:ferrochelatase [Ectothiorhodospiraceae bacterium]
MSDATPSPGGRYVGTPEFAHDAARPDGILLANLGTPDAPGVAAVRRYLAEFLWDPRVVEMARPLWWLILHGVILRVRPRRTAEAYAKVWTDEGSPLLVHSRRQAAGVAERLAAAWPDAAVRVELGMRYGNPSIPDALERLRQAGVGRLLVLPLYPQYSGSTTGSVFDAVATTVGRWRWLPELRFVTHYHDDEAHVAALAASIAEARATSGAGERLLFSFHGLPRRYLDAGDPYHCQCHATARRVTEALGLGPEAWGLSFQSRVGREEWLRPYTDDLLREWAAAGVRSVDVVCPGFAADCLETLEEVAMGYGELFESAGGERLRYIPALNDRADHLDALTALVLARTADWRTAAGAPPDAARRAATRRRALALGARQ